MIRECTLCGEKAFDQNLLLCKKHLKEYYRNRWDAGRNGPDALQLFAYECFPQIFKNEFEPSWYHHEMIQCIYHGLYEAQDNLDAIFAFLIHRYGAKTTWSSFMTTLYVLAYERKKFIVYRSDTLPKAQRNWLARVRRGLQQPRFKFVYGEMVPKRKDTGLKDTETVMIVKNKVMAMLVAMGFEQSTTSFVNWDVRIDLIFEDDVESDDNTRSDEAIQRVLDKVLGQDFNAMDRTGMMILCQTPIKPTGLYWSILANKAFKKVVAPCFEVDESGNPKLDENGLEIPSWPSFWSRERLLKQKAAVGLKMWYREWLLQNMIDTDTSVDPSTIQYCTIEKKFEHNVHWVMMRTINARAVEEPKWEAMRVIAIFDLATSEEGKSSDTAGMVLGILKGMRYIVLHYFAGKYRARDVTLADGKLGPYDIELNAANIEKAGIVGELFRIAFYWKWELCIIETIGEYENTYREVGYSYDRWYLKQKGAHPFSFMGHKPKTHGPAKKSRIISAIGPNYERRAVYHVGTPVSTSFGWELATLPMRELYNQITDIPGTGKLDLADVEHIGMLFGTEPDVVSEEEARLKEYEDGPDASERDPLVALHGSLFV